MTETQRAHERTPFRDRIEAGRALAARLSEYGNRTDVLVLGLPRGGVPVAAQVALALRAPLDVWLVRKLGVPGHEEFAMGAIASGGIVELSAEVVRHLGLSEKQVQRVLRSELIELERRERAYRGDRPAPALGGRAILLVDDGLATGSTMRAAVSSVRKHAPKAVIVAVPVASSQARAELEGIADGCMCVLVPEPFGSVGAWYRDFDATTDAEVVARLRSVDETGRSRAVSET
jgi:putative phosphoribosyl transferase